MLTLTLAVPVIIGIVEAIKKIGLSSTWAPIVSILLGMVVYFFWGEAFVAENLFTGLVAGLTASGLYSGVKTVVN